MSINNSNKNNKNQTWCNKKTFTFNILLPLLPSVILRKLLGNDVMSMMTGHSPLNLVFFSGGATFFVWFMSKF